MRSQWFCSGLESSVSFHDTPEAALAAAKEWLENAKDQAEDGWDPDVTDICWGEITERVVETLREPAVDAKARGIQMREDFDEYVEFDLVPLSWSQGAIWNDFREKGLLFMVNTLLHLIGWTLFVNYDAKTGGVIGVHPTRSKLRGFTPEVADGAFRRLHAYLAESMAAVNQETQEQEGPMPKGKTPEGWTSRVYVKSVVVETEGSLIEPSKEQT